MTTRPRLLRAMTTAQLSLLERPLLVVPVGSCEQHGPHLPLGTDTVIAEALCAALAMANERVIIGPSLEVTSSGEHAGFVGTLSIGGPTTSASIVELVRSADWADDVLFVNGHGGNATAVHDALTTLRSESRKVTAWWPRIDDGDAHAGHIETSLMLFLDPDKVDLQRAQVGNTQPLGELAERLRHEGVRGVSANGILGDPRHASRADGERLMDLLVRQLSTHADRHHP